MRMVPGLLAIALLGCGSNGAPGGGGSICTTIGCTDELTATLHDATGGLPAGKQVLTVTANGTTLTCSFTLPRAGGAGAETCPKGLTVTIVQAQSCETTGAGATCTPIADQFQEKVTLVGSPTTVMVSQTVDGKSYLAETATPTYTTTRPNGPNCAPVCSQAMVEWVLAPQ